MKKKIVVAFMAGVVSMGSAFAQQYPSKPIQLVAPFGPGGDADLAARNLAAAAHAHLPQPMVVMNRAGAGGTVGTLAVKEAAPDGYTLLLSRVGSHAIAPAIQPGLKYKWNDFTFISLLELNPMVCIVRADSPVKTLTDLVDSLKKNPGKLTYSTSGTGTVLNFATQTLFDAAKLGKNAAVEVPYKSGGEAATAVASSQADFSCLNLGPALPLMRGNRVRAIVQTVPERFKDLPDVPTAREAGYPQLEVMVGWSALVGPPNMPKDVVNRLSAAMAKIGADPKWTSGTEKIGGMPKPTTPEEAAKFVGEQVAVYERLGKLLNIEIK